MSISTPACSASAAACADVLRDPVCDELGDGVEIAHHHAIEAPTLAHRIPQQRGVGGGRDAARSMKQGIIAATPASTAARNGGR